MQHIKVISLDLDDTLWHLGPVILRAEEAVYQWFQEFYPAVTQRFTREAVRAMRRTVEADFPGREHDFPLLRRATFSRLARESGYTRDPADEAFAAFQRVRNQVTPFGDVHAGLERLARRATVVALTNGTADLAAIGLRGYFTEVFTACELGAAKPDPRAFRHVCDRLGVPPSQVAHAGDDPHTDVDGARALGMAAIWVNRDARRWPAGLAPAGHVVRDLHELAELLGA